MASNEIVKALKCCNSTKRGKCLNEYPYHDYSANCSQEMIDDALNLINRQQAEIEALQMENNQLQSDIVNANGNYEEIKKDCEMLKQALAQKIVFEIKTEAIKEFGKFLIDKSQNGAISICDISDCVIEMVGENNG